VNRWSRLQKESAKVKTEKSIAYSKQHFAYNFLIQLSAVSKKLRWLKAENRHRITNLKKNKIILNSIFGWGL
tara:strand:- start:59058 stop:59273 length:216 start_codon:yes stop_codon:yes gene_type:complete